MPYRHLLTSVFLRTASLLLLSIFLVATATSCNKRDEYGVPTGDMGLHAGMNYMQPNKWEFSYKYRVKNIEPLKPIRDNNPSSFDPGIGVVGTGTYEIWIPGPIESDEVRNVQLISADPEPTATEYLPEHGITFLYYDVAPDDRLPQSFEIDVTYSFYTFERYVHWDGIEDMVKPYDRESELYKRYTREEYPIEFHKGLVKDARGCVAGDGPMDTIDTCLNIYNLIISEYQYDYKHMQYIAVGEDGLIPTSRVWINKRGICDEFANLFVAMARSVGIPSRPCAGWSHQPLDEQLKALTDDEREQLEDLNININRNIGRPGGHSWAEFYLEGVGWVPVDATWGNDVEIIPSEISPMGNRRNIRYVDYYFGKMDPYRLTMFKSWNYDLTPEPRTPDAERMVPWMSKPVSRHSGIRDITRGFDWTYDVPGGGHLAYFEPPEVQSEQMWEMKNSRHRIVHVAEMPDEELTALISEIESEGSHFVKVPTYEWEKDRQETTYFSW